MSVPATAQQLTALTTAQQRAAAHIRFHTHGPIFLGNSFIVISFALLGAVWSSYLPSASRTLYAKFLASHVWLEPGAGVASIPDTLMRLLLALCTGDLVRTVSGPVMLWVSWVWANYNLHIDDQAAWKCLFSRVTWGKLEEANVQAHIVAIGILASQCATVFYPFSLSCALPEDAASLAGGAYHADSQTFKLLLCVRGAARCQWGQSPTPTTHSRFQRPTPTPTPALFAPCRQPTLASLARALQRSLRPTSKRRTPRRLLLLCAASRAPLLYPRAGWPTHLPSLVQKKPKVIYAAWGFLV